MHLLAQLLDLLDEVGLLLLELFVLAVLLEVVEEADQLRLVLDENVEDGLGLVRVGDEHLKNMERFELDALALVAEQHHHQLQVGRVSDVLRHNVEVRSVKKKLCQKLRETSVEASARD